MIADDLRDRVRAAVTIDRDDLAYEYERTPSDVEDLAYEYARAKEALEVFKARYDQARAEYRETRRDELLTGGTKPSEARLDAEAEADDALLARREQIARCSAKVAYLKHALKAVDHKVQMLIGLGAHERQERDALRRGT